ncbi:MAG: hypothetical protein EOO77_04680 [Oxalobacteraceae bacterium]|nr:MAG: hypothetical protein EOO77_04680 [Oxalobacteraceae bacterium]
MHLPEVNALRTARILIDRAKTQRDQHAALVEATRAALLASRDRITRLEAKYDQLPGVSR